MSERILWCGDFTPYYYAEMQKSRPERWAELVEIQAQRGLAWNGKQWAPSSDAS